MIATLKPRSITKQRKAAICYCCYSYAFDYALYKQDLAQAEQHLSQMQITLAGNELHKSMADANKLNFLQDRYAMRIAQGNYEGAEVFCVICCYGSKLCCSAL